MSPKAAPTPVETRITAGRAAANALVAAGVDHVFCVPGESFMGLLNALYDEPRIRVVATRHEGGASFMAEAYGKLTRKPAVCMGTRMVGGANMTIGIHTAKQDSTPLIAIFGQVTTDARYREAFQEVELAHVYGPVSKWAVEPPSAERIGELTWRAAREAVSGRPGPVAIAYREELLDELVRAETYAPITPPRPAPDPAGVRQTLNLLRAAERPILLVGAGVLATESTAVLVKLAEELEVPVATTMRRQDGFPNDHRLFLGQTGLWAPPFVVQRLLEADVLVAIGTRLTESASAGYRIPGPDTQFVHVDVAAESIGAHRVVPQLGVVSDTKLFIEALHVEAKRSPIADDIRARWAARNAADRRILDESTTPARRGTSRPSFVDQQALSWHLRRIMPANAIVTADAGNFAGWPQRYLRWNQPRTFLGPISGAMGYGVPSGIAAKMARPNQPVVTFAGDGGFLMTGTEIETAVRERVPFVMIVIDNQRYGTIRMHQQRDHPGRPLATDLGPVDFAAFARSMGALGTTIRDDAEFPSAFEEAINSDKPVLLHVPVDPEQESVLSDNAAEPEQVAAR